MRHIHHGLLKASLGDNMGECPCKPGPLVVDADVLVEEEAESDLDLLVPMSTLHLAGVPVITPVCSFAGSGTTGSPTGGVGISLGIGLIRDL